MSKPTGVKSYYLTKIEALEQRLTERTQNIKRLEAQRNDLNNQGKVPSPNPLLSPLSQAPP